MKRAVLLIYALVVISTITFGDDIIENRNARNRTELFQTCLKKGNITFKEYIDSRQRLDQVQDYDINTMRFDETILKIGCFLACLLQDTKIMSGAHINSTVLMKLPDQIFHNRLPHTPENFKRKKMLNCINEIEETTDECGTGVKIFWCMHRQWKDEYTTFEKDGEYSSNGIN